MGGARGSAAGGGTDDLQGMTTLLPALQMKENGANSGLNSKLPQVEIRKIKNGDRADLVAYGPKSSID